MTNKNIVPVVIGYGLSLGGLFLAAWVISKAWKKGQA